jgi:DNA mismatch endonuclease (patch repair protein)
MVVGCFWHGYPDHVTWPMANAAWWREKILGNARRDRDTDAQLRLAGWKVLRFWEHDDAVRSAQKVAAVVRRRLTG